MHPYFNEAVIASRIAELRRTAERSRALGPRTRAHLGARTAVAIRRYFEHERTSDE
jgi:hypothetical protein